MENVEITPQMAMTLETIFQFWPAQYKSLWREISTEHKRNPNQKEINKSFADICERHAGLSFYFGMTKDDFVDFTFEIKERLKKKKQKLKNLNQLSLDFTEEKPKGRVCLTGSFEEQLRIMTGYYASKATKKYRRLKRKPF